MRTGTAGTGKHLSQIQGDGDPSPTRSGELHGARRISHGGVGGRCRASRDTDGVRAPGVQARDGVGHGGTSRHAHAYSDIAVPARLHTWSPRGREWEWEWEWDRCF